MNQFDNINADADKAAEAWLERRSEFFDPYRDDEGSISFAGNRGSGSGVFKCHHGVLERDSREPL